MTTKYLYRVAIVIIIALMFSQSIYFAEEHHQKNILIINSYHYGLSWTDDSTNAEIRTIKEQFSGDVRFFVEFMDWKEHPTKENVVAFQSAIEHKYKQKQIDLIIASDDAALEFVINNRNTLFRDIPIVFHSVSESSFDALVHDSSALTGVLEIVDIQTTLEIAMMVNPEMTTFYVVYDETESGKAMGETAVTEMKKHYPGIEVIVLTDLSIQEILERVGKLSASDSIMMTAYYTDRLKQNINFEDMIKKVSEATPAAVFSLYDFALGNGALGGNLLSANLIGERAGELAVQILNGKSPEDIPAVRAGIHITVIDYFEAKAFGLDLEALSSKVTIVNRPISFYEANKTIVLVTLFIMALMLIFMVVLSFLLRKTVQLKNNLVEKNSELKSLYDELSASEEELKAQFDALNDLFDVLQENKKESERVASSIKHAAYHDALTGYPNKAALEEHIEKLHLKSKSPFGILLIDIDHFKRINDTMGHRFGDKYIKAIGEIIEKSLSQSAKIFRINGDEFVIYISEAESDEVDRFAEYLINLLNRVVQVDYSNFSNSVSIGISMYPLDGEALETLLTRADLAMYKAKEAGRGKAIRYDGAMYDHIVWRVTREEALKKALDRNEFSLVYQPQLNIKTNEIMGFEALLRWENKKLGKISPLEFIPLAEETQLILPIGSWVIHHAIKHLSNINRHNETEKYHMAVNVSVLQIIQDDFEQIVLEALSKYNVDPNQFTIEITETVLMQSVDTSIDKLRRLREKGIKISLDDFGTGYSSLSYLKTLPLDILKIDKSFIDEIGESSAQNDFVKLIISLGKQLNLTIVAEGVEVEAQFEVIKKMQCDAMQGYFYSHPLSEQDSLKLV